MYLPFLVSLPSSYLLYRKFNCYNIGLGPLFDVVENRTSDSLVTYPWQEPSAPLEKFKVLGEPCAENVHTDSKLILLLFISHTVLPRTHEQPSLLLLYTRP